MSSKIKAVFKIKPGGPGSFSSKDRPEGLPERFTRGVIYETSSAEAIEWLSQKTEFRVLLEEIPSPQPSTKPSDVKPTKAASSVKADKPKKAVKTAPKKAVKTAPKKAVKAAAKKATTKKAPAKKSTSTKSKASKE